MDSPYDSLFSEADLEKYSALWDRKYVRVDPETRKPHTYPKGQESFWEIVHMFPAVPAGGNNNAPQMQFQVQRFLLNKTYEAKTPDGKGGVNGSLTRHVAWNDLNRKGELVSPGYVTVDYEGFKKQFEPAK